MRRKKKQSMVLVGIDEGELLEQGIIRDGRSLVVQGRRSTHGIAAREVEQLAIVYPRKNSVQVNVRSRSLTGERMESLPVAEEALRKLSIVGLGNTKTAMAEARTVLDGGRRWGWDTIRVPNRYDYYLEGHRINRVSRVRAKSSMDGEGENRI